MENSEVMVEWLLRSQWQTPVEWRGTTSSLEWSVIRSLPWTHKSQCLPYSLSDSSTRFVQGLKLWIGSLPSIMISSAELGGLWLDLAKDWADEMIVSQLVSLILVADLEYLVWRVPQINKLNWVNFNLVFFCLPSTETFGAALKAIGMPAIFSKLIVLVCQSVYVCSTCQTVSNCN